MENTDKDPVRVTDDPVPSFIIDGEPSPFGTKWDGLGCIGYLMIEGGYGAADPDQIIRLLDSMLATGAPKLPDGVTDEAFSEYESMIRTGASNQKEVLSAYRGEGPAGIWIDPPFASCSVSSTMCP